MIVQSFNCCICHAELYKFTYKFCVTETFYHFGDNDRERWDPLFSLYQLPPYQLPDMEPVLSFGLAGNGKVIIVRSTSISLESRKVDLGIVSKWICTTVMQAQVLVFPFTYMDPHLLKQSLEER